MTGSPGREQCAHSTSRVTRRSKGAFTLADTIAAPPVAQGESWHCPGCATPRCLSCKVANLKTLVERLGVEPSEASLQGKHEPRLAPHKYHRPSGLSLSLTAGVLHEDRPQESHGVWRRGRPRHHHEPESITSALRAAITADAARRSLARSILGETDPGLGAMRDGCDVGYPCRAARAPAERNAASRPPFQEG
jgi:hypothetical protein